MKKRVDWQEVPQDVIGEPSNIMYLHSKCHINIPTWTYVDFEKNHAVIECAECGQEVFRMKLAERN